MAQDLRKDANDKSESRMPTQQDVSMAGGVWAPTSAKRDKLAELKGELTEDQPSLDDAATPEQVLDLYLADGLQWIVHTVDQTRLGDYVSPMSSTADAADTTTEYTKDKATSEVLELPPMLDPNQWEMEEPIQNVEAWLQQQRSSIASTIPGGQLTQTQWETYLDETIQKIDEALATLPPARYLTYVRDFYEIPSAEAKEGLIEQHLQETLVESAEQQALTAAGSKLLARYRLLLTKSTCEQLKDSWGTLTTLTDEALDRLAVKHPEGGEEDNDNENSGETSATSTIPADGVISTLSLDKLNQVVRASLMGGASDRVDAWWDMLDHENSGLLEKTEMELACTSTVACVQSATKTLFQEALDASPVRGLEVENPTTTATASEENDGSRKKGTTPPKPGWRQRRREAKAKKRLTKLFQLADKTHFEDEVEMPHRLRCIYAWAEKAHQNNKLDSVLIEASGWSGRKRYVELQPKISLSEFREVQQVHFTHLDRIGWEITKSFRENLWVDQGTGRQNAELKRECAGFLLAVSVIDYVIIIL